MVGKYPWYVPVALAVTVALATAYSIANGLDRRVATLAKLQTEWHSLSVEYDWLLNHWREDPRGEIGKALIERARDASLLATTDAPYHEELMDKWSVHVNQGYRARRRTPAVA